MSVGLLARLAARARSSGFATGLLVDTRARPDARGHVAALHRDRLLGGAPARAARPRPRARAARGRRGGDRGRRDRDGADPVPARRRRAGQPAAAPADLHHRARQHADRAAGVRARAHGSSGRRCPTIRAGAGAAPTRPAGSARCSSPSRAARPDPAELADDPAARGPPAADDAAARAARGDRRQLRAGDVRDHLLPALVPAGAVRRPVRRTRRPSTACATSRSRRRAARSSTAPGHVLVGSTKALEVQISPPDLPHSARRPAPSCSGAWRACWGSRPGRSSARSPGRRRPAARSAVAQIPCDVEQQLALLPYADVDDQARSASTSSTTWPSASSSSAACRWPQVYIPSYPQGDLAAQLLGTVGRITAQECWGRTPRRARRRCAPRRPIVASTRTRSSASPAWRASTTATCAGSTDPSRSRSTRFGQPTRDLQDDAAGPRPQPRAVARRQPAARRPAGAGDRRSRRTRAPTAARSSR